MLRIRYFIIWMLRIRYMDPVLLTARLGEQIRLKRLNRGLTQAEPASLGFRLPAEGGRSGRRARAGSRVRTASGARR